MNDNFINSLKHLLNEILEYLKYTKDHKKSIHNYCKQNNS